MVLTSLSICVSKRIAMWMLWFIRGILLQHVLVVTYCSHFAADTASNDGDGVSNSSFRSLSGNNFQERVLTQNGHEPLQRLFAASFNTSSSSSNIKNKHHHQQQHVTKSSNIWSNVSFAGDGSSLSLYVRLVPCYNYLLAIKSLKSSAPYCMSLTFGQPATGRVKSQQDFSLFFQPSSDFLWVPCNQQSLSQKLFKCGLTDCSIRQGLFHACTQDRRQCNFSIGQGTNQISGYLALETLNMYTTPDLQTNQKSFTPFLLGCPAMNVSLGGAGLSRAATSVFWQLIMRYNVPKLFAYCLPGPYELGIDRRGNAGSLLVFGADATKFVDEERRIKVAMNVIGTNLYEIYMVGVRLEGFEAIPMPTTIAVIDAGTFDTLLPEGVYHSLFLIFEDFLVENNLQRIVIKNPSRTDDILCFDMSENLRVQFPDLKFILLGAENVTIESSYYLFHYPEKQNPNKKCLAFNISPNEKILFGAFNQVNKLLVIDAEENELVIQDQDCSQFRAAYGGY